MKLQLNARGFGLPHLLGCSIVAVCCLMAEKEPTSFDAEDRFENVKKAEDLPPSRLRDDIDALEPAAHKRAMEIFQDNVFSTADIEQLHVCNQGTPFYVCGPGCEHALDEGELGKSADVDLVAEMEETITTFSAAVPVSPFPENLKFHSKPGAPYVIFLNFAGDTISGTQWNNHQTWAPGPSVPIQVRPFNLTGEDPSEYSPLEQQRIFRTWLRVAEDYAPFNINVTTERPSQAMFDTNQVVHVIFSEQFDENGHQVPFWDLGIGVASIGTFGNSDFNSMRNPAWVFTKALFDRQLGDVASHEAGHTFGLFHHGLTTISQDIEYYPGHGSGETQWVPLMGNIGLNRRITQWSNGEYRNANRTNQDDIAIIASKTGFRSEDHGNTNATATPLSIGSDGVINSTTLETDPENNFPQNKGIIGSRTDVDVFRFTAGAGDITLNVVPFRILTGTQIPGSRGTNLDASIELYNSAGVLVASDNPPDDTITSITYHAAPGTYYLHVSGSGAGDPFASDPTGYTDYGSLGHYSITGSISPAASIYLDWAVANGLSGDDVGPDVILQPDGLTNLQRFAFGLDPNSASFGPLEFIMDGELTNPGVPTLQISSALATEDEVKGVFIRRKDYEAAGLTYTVQFSADLKQWTPSNTSPTVLTDANSTSDHEVVGIPFPNSVPVAGGGEPLAARFMRLVVTLE